MFKKSLYFILNVSTKVSEDDIQNAYNYQIQLTNTSFGATSAELQKLKQLGNQIKDTEFRLYSMIVSGEYGEDSLDLQNGRVKKILNSRQIVSQEWVDVLSSYYVLLTNSDFQTKILNTCNLTQPDNEQDIQYFHQARDKIFTHIWDYLIHAIQDSIARNDLKNLFECFAIFEKIPGFSQEFKTIYRSKVSQLIHEFITRGIKDVHDKLNELENKKSDLMTGEEFSRLGFQLKDKFSVFEEYLIKFDKKDLIPLLHATYQKFCELAPKFNKPRLVPYFEDILKIPQQQPEPSQDASSKKQKKTKISKPKIEQSEILNTLKQNNVNRARSLFSQYMKQATTPEETQWVEKVKNDPYFFIDTSNKNVKGLLKVPLNKIFVTEDEHYIQIVWFGCGLPVFPLYGVARKKNHDVLGRVDLPFHFLILKYAIPLGLIFIVLTSITLFKFSQHDTHIGSSTRVKKSETSLPIKVKVEMPVISEQQTIVDIWQGYLNSNDLKGFLEKYGQPLLSADRKMKEEYFFLLQDHFKKFIYENGLTHDTQLTDWMFKFGGGDFAVSLIGVYLAHYQNETKDSHIWENALDFVKAYTLSLPHEFLFPLVKLGQISVHEYLTLVLDPSKVPESFWVFVMRKLWEGRYSSRCDVLSLLNKVPKNLQSTFRVDLLQMIYDPVKDEKYPWHQLIQEKFQYQFVEEGVLYRIARYYLEKGDIDEMNEIWFKLNGKNRSHFFKWNMIPLLFINNLDSLLQKFMNELSDTYKKNSQYQFINFLMTFRMRPSDDSFNQLQKLSVKWSDKLMKDWKNLAQRKTDVRELFYKKLSERKGEYYEMSRKIFLIHDPIEAEELKESYALDEINKDHRVMEIKNSIKRKEFVFRAIFEFYFTVLMSKNTDWIGKISETLASWQDIILDLRASILIGVHAHLRNDQNKTENTFKHVEDTILREENYKDLMVLIEVYQKSGQLKELKRLLKYVLKNDFYQKFKNNIFLKLSMIENDPSESMQWISKIKNQTAEVEIQKALLEIKISKNRTPKVAQEQSHALLKNLEWVLNSKNGHLMHAYGTELYYAYRYGFGRTYLDAAATCLFESLYWSGYDSLLFNRYFHIIWYQVLLDNLGDFYEAHLLSHHYESPFWFAIMQAFNTPDSKHTFLNAFTSSENIVKMTEVFKKFNNHQIPFLSPPSFTPFIDILKLAPYFNLEKLKPEFFNQKIWPEDPVTDEFMTHYFASKEDTLKKQLKSVENKDGSIQKKEDAPALFEWALKTLLIWSKSNEPLKMGFDILLGKVEFASILDNSLQSRYVLLAVKLYRFSEWFDPEKKLLPSLEPAYAICKSILKGQALKEGLRENVFKDIQEFLDAIKPLKHNSLELLLNIENQMDTSTLRKESIYYHYLPENMRQVWLDRVQKRP